MKIWYARVSSSGQQLDVQIEKLKDYGCEKIFQEKQTGKTANDRMELQNALQFAREWDVVVVTKLDRLARSISDLISITKDLEKRGIGFAVLDQQIDTTSPTGRLLFNLLWVVGEFERELIHERATDWIRRAKAIGVQFGRPVKLTPKEAETFRVEFNNPPDGMSKTDVARKYGMSRASGYRIALWKNVVDLV